MASAKRLTTTELGATRYAQAEASGLWPIEVRLPRGTQAHKYTLHVPSYRPMPFQRDVTGGFRASLEVPEGSLTYEIRNASELISTGGLLVSTPEVPITGNRLAADLHAKPMSGAVQLGKEEAEKIHGWPVQFVYQEETWSVKEVMVVCDDLDLEIPLTRYTDGAFKGIAEVELGPLEYRFCIVPREPTRSDQAPFTRLGWDDAESLPISLMTWPLKLDVKDLGKTNGMRTVPVKPGGQLARKKSVGTSASKLGLPDVTKPAVALPAVPAPEPSTPPAACRNAKSIRTDTNCPALLAITTVACAFGAALLLLLCRPDNSDEPQSHPTKRSPSLKGNPPSGTSPADQTVLRHANGTAF